MPALRFGHAEIRPAERQLLIDGRPAALGARAFDLLLALVERRDRVVPKGELLDLVWPGLVVEENNLQVHISALRKLLGPQAIATVPGRGYRFTAAIDPGDSESAADVAPAPAEAAAPPRSGNLPAHAPALIGREQDLQAVCALLRGHALVSVVGAGGIGKSALAQAVAAALRGECGDGAWWVELAAVNEADRVADAVAQTLGIAVSSQRPAVTALVETLRPQDALLVLDSCEQVLGAVARLAETLLLHCPRLRLLVTSQETLRLNAEQAYRLGGLAVPAADEPARADAGAIALFIARARAAEPRLRFDAGNLPTVAAICRALDGIPLAIELAAARAPLLGIEGLHQRLDERFRVLTGGARLVLRRHQTLRAALEWSHGLLTDGEKAVFRRLGIFAGGFPLELAQAVATDETVDPWTVLDLLGHLVDKSLVAVDAGDPPRYRLLESTRAFALEQLGAAGETATLLRRHAQALHDYLAPLHARYWALDAAGQARATAELDNLRAALDWAGGPGGDRRLACELLGVSNLTWHSSGQLLEGLGRARRLLPLEPLPSATEARFQLTFARLGYLGARAECFAAAGRAAELFRALADDSGLADALIARTLIGTRRGLVAEVDAAAAEAERLLPPATPPRQRATLALAQALRHVMRDELGQAVEAALRQADCYREDGSTVGLALAQANAALYESWLGRYQSAIDRLHEAAAGLGSKPADHTIDNSTGFLAFALALRDAPGDFERALALGRQAWPLLRRQQRCEWLLLAMAVALAGHGAADRAAQLVGYFDAAIAQEGMVPWPFFERLRRRTVERIGATLGDAAAAELIAAGAALGDERAARLAFGEERDGRSG